MLKPFTVKKSVIHQPDQLLHKFAHLLQFLNVYKHVLCLHKKKRNIG